MSFTRAIVPHVRLTTSTISASKDELNVPNSFMQQGPQMAFCFYHGREPRSSGQAFAAWLILFRVNLDAVKKKDINKPGRHKIDPKLESSCSGAATIQ